MRKVTGGIGIGKEDEMELMRLRDGSNAGLWHTWSPWEMGSGTHFAHV